MKTQILFAAILILFFASCEKEEPQDECEQSQITYTNGIKEIIDGTCANDYCHGSGASIGDWTTYSTIKPVLDNGVFEQRVLIDQDMPAAGPLDDETLDKIQCWADRGFPE